MHYSTVLNRSIAKTGNYSLEPPSTRHSTLWLYCLFLACLIFAFVFCLSYLFVFVYSFGLGWGGGRARGRKGVGQCYRAEAYRIQLFRERLSNKSVRDNAERYYG